MKTTFETLTSEFGWLFAAKIILWSGKRYAILNYRRLFSGKALTSENEWFFDLLFSDLQST